MLGVPGHAVHAHAARPVTGRCALRRTAFALAISLGACATPVAEPRTSGVAPAASRRVTQSASPAVAVLAPIEADQDPASLDPSILEPSRTASDEVVAVVGGVELRKSHVYDRLVDSNRRVAATYVDLLVTDAVVAQHARAHAISLDRAEVDRIADAEESALRGQVRLEHGGALDFEGYLRRQLDMSQAEYREFLRRELARQRYRALVIRYLALLEDRVEVRFLVNRNPALVAESRRKIAEGADFATLAMRHSEDETRRDGGLMPPFSRSFRHPIAKVAFELEPGDLSPVFEFEEGGVSRSCIVYCLRRMPGREVGYAAVRDEILRELEDRPLTPFELKAFTLRWCQPTPPSGVPDASRGVR